LFHTTEPPLCSDLVQRLRIRAPILQPARTSWNDSDRMRRSVPFLSDRISSRARNDRPCGQTAGPRIRARGVALPLRALNSARVADTFFAMSKHQRRQGETVNGDRTSVTGRPLPQLTPFQMRCSDCNSDSAIPRRRWIRSWCVSWRPASRYNHFPRFQLIADSTGTPSRIPSPEPTLSPVPPVHCDDAEATAGGT